MSRIFISYRREDSSAYAGRIGDRLANHFGKSNVFMDVDNIPPGADFVEVLQATVNSCEIALVVIGKGWLSASNAAGQRLQNPDDFVRIEIAAALERNILVIPILVGGAGIPPSEALPFDIKKLAQRQALIVSDHDFHRALDKLVGTIGREADRKAEQERLAREQAEAAAKAEQERLARETEAPTERGRLEWEAAAKAKQKHFEGEDAVKGERVLSNRYSNDIQLKEILQSVNTASRPNETAKLQSSSKADVADSLVMRLSVLLGMSLAVFGCFRLASWTVPWLIIRIAAGCLACWFLYGISMNIYDIRNILRKKEH